MPLRPLSILQNHFFKTKKEQNPQKYFGRELHGILIP